MIKQLVFQGIKYPVSNLMTFKERKEYRNKMKEIVGNTKTSELEDEQGDAIFNLQTEYIQKITDNKITKDMIENSTAIDVDKLLEDSFSFISDKINLKK